MGCRMVIVGPSDENIDRPPFFSGRNDHRRIVNQPGMAVNGPASGIEEKKPAFLGEGNCLVATFLVDFPHRVKGHH